MYDEMVKNFKAQVDGDQLQRRRHQNAAQRGEGDEDVKLADLHVSLFQILAGKEKT